MTELETTTMAPPASTAATPLIEFEHVSIGFGGTPVLDDVSFVLEPGETKIVLGTAGSGKSVMLKLVTGLLQANKGTIRVHGRDITHLHEDELFEVRKNIGMVFQEGALFDSLTIGENVGYVFERMREVPEEEAERRVREALRFVELEPTYDQYPPELSGGMRRRVAIARALVGQPDLLLYDSPTAGLDPITSQRIIALIIKQRDARHVSSLLVTHRLQDAYYIASFRYNAAGDKLIPVKNIADAQRAHTRFMLLKDGRIVFHGGLNDMLTSGDPYLQKFLA
jgi:phospholipid/cholesterol/gamma-HCH transport system ATP-binding protein